MTDFPLGNLLGTVLGAGLILITMDVLFDRRTGKYFDKPTGKEITKEEAEKRRLKEVI
jgi:hypothetical protein